MGNIRKGLVAASVMAALMLCGIALTGQETARAADDKDTVTIGWTAWSDAEFVTRLAKRLIEDRLDIHVALKLSAIDAQYQDVASGRLDAMLMAWLPDTHETYWNAAKSHVDDLGTIYNGARLGWVVPDYVPASVLASIPDLAKPSVAKKLGGRIHGIDPGAGLMQLSNKALDTYDLAKRYDLMGSSAADMTAALSQAIENKRWIVVTGWTPHWMFGKYALRFLDDPKHVLGRAQHVDAVARQGFRRNFPDVAAFLSRMHIPLADLQTAMYHARASGTAAAIDRFIDEHPNLVNSWFADTD